MCLLFLYMKGIDYIMVRRLAERLDIPKVDVNGFSYRDAKKNADAATKRDGYDNAVLLSPDGSFTIARLGYDGKPVGWEPEGTRILYISKSDWSGGVHKAVGTEISQDTFESRSVSNNRSKRFNESFDKYLDNVYSYVRKINNEVPPSDGYLDVYDCGDGRYKLVVMDDRGRVIKDVSDCYKPMPFVSFVRGLYQTLKQW